MNRRRFVKSLGTAGALGPLHALPPRDTAPSVLRLSANESAYGPFPSIARAMAQASAEKGAYYVGPEAQKVRDKLSERFGIPARQILLGAGSGEPLRVATEVFSEEGRPPVIAEPTFEAVARAAGIAGIEAIKIPLTPGGVHDVERMIEAARRHSAGMLYLVNPANPTGTIISGGQLAWVVENLPAGTVLLADEAYCDFVSDPAYKSALPYVKEGKPVVVLRTFSKIYGLAGMRLGYAVGRPDLIARMAPRMLGGMALNQAVVAGALAGLEDKEHYQYIKNEYLRVRRYVIEEFATLGYQCYPSQANFIMVDLRRPIEPVSARLAEKGFAVGRLFPSLPNHLRITLGKMEDMRRFMVVVGEILRA